VAEDWADSRPPRWRPTDRHEQWLGLALGVLFPLVLSAVIVLAYCLGRWWL
jgi:hypothetical protein